MSEDAAYAAGYRDGVAAVLESVSTAAAIVPDLLPIGASVPTLPDLANRLATIDPTRLRILKPFCPAEAIDLQQAGHLAGGRHPNTVSEWVQRYGIGRSVVGRVLVSKPGLLMLLDGDALALMLLLDGQRESPVVRPYFERVGL